MKFLQESTPNSKPEPGAIQIKKIYKVNMQCNNDECDFWGQMEGGPLVSDETKAMFVCPICDTLNPMKWGFNL